MRRDGVAVQLVGGVGVWHAYAHHGAPARHFLDDMVDVWHGGEVDEGGQTGGWDGNRTSGYLSHSDATAFFLFSVVMQKPIRKSLEISPRQRTLGS